MTGQEDVGCSVSGCCDRDVGGGSDVRGGPGVSGDGAGGADIKGSVCGVCSLDIGAVSTESAAEGSEDSIGSSPSCKVVSCTSRLLEEGWVRSCPLAGEWNFLWDVTRCITQTRSIVRGPHSSVSNGEYLGGKEKD